MIDEKTLTHLTNLLRHSSEVEFTIPTILFINDETPKTEHFQKKINKIKEAYEYFNKHPDYETSMTLGLDIDETKVRIKVVK